MTDEDQYRPLLGSDRRRLHHASEDFVSRNLTDQSSTAYRIRCFLQRFLTSKYGHYFVMILVTLDVAGIFADFLISLHICEHSKEDVRSWRRLSQALSVLSLTFSCMFMIELLCSIFAFGPSYFRCKFQCFDATAIVASFLVDVLTHGSIEEAGSLIIILRLFRVFKIVEESSTVATETVDSYEEQIRDLMKENQELRETILNMPFALLGVSRND